MSACQCEGQQTRRLAFQALNQTRSVESAAVVWSISPLQIQLFCATSLLVSVMQHLQLHGSMRRHSRHGRGSSCQLARLLRNCSPREGILSTFRSPRTSLSLVAPLHNTTICLLATRCCRVRLSQLFSQRLSSRPRTQNKWYNQLYVLKVYSKIPFDLHIDLTALGVPLRVLPGTIANLATNSLLRQ